MTEQRRNSTHDRRHSRIMRAGLTASLLLHALVVLLFSGQSIPASPFAAAGERRGSDRAATGGGMEAVELRTPTSEPETPPPLDPAPTAEPVPEPPQPEISLEEIPAIALAQGLSMPGAPGPNIGPGLLIGEGEGDGGTEAEGRFRVVPPRPRGLILPPGDRPRSVRGKEVEVWVFVTASGQVVPDSTRLLPPTGDRGFDRRLRDHAAGWVFEAARRDGRAVPEWFTYTVVM